MGVSGGTEQLACCSRSRFDRKHRLGLLAEVISPRVRVGPRISCCGRQCLLCVSGRFLDDWTSACLDDALLPRLLVDRHGEDGLTVKGEPAGWRLGSRSYEPFAWIGQACNFDHWCKACSVAPAGTGQSLNKNLTVRLRILIGPESSKGGLGAVRHSDSVPIFGWSRILMAARMVSDLEPDTYTINQPAKI